MLWSARDAVGETVASGAKASIAWSARDATVEAAVAGLRASMTWTARDAVGELAWEPSELPLTGWWRDYAGGNWTGTASAGTSGSNDLLVENEPDVGTALNGHGTADFGGFNDTLIADGSTDTYINATAFGGWVLLNPDGVAGTKSILHDASHRFRVRIIDGAVVLDVNVGAASVSRAISASAWSLVTFRYTGTALAIGVNEIPGAAGGGATTAYSSSVTGITGNLSAGGSNPNYYAGLIAEIGLSDTAPTDQNFTDVLGYIEQQYGLSI